MLTAMLAILAAVTVPQKQPQPRCPNPTPSSAYFLKIDGIPGDSRDMCHLDEIEALGFQNSGSSMTVVKKIDMSTPQLLLAVLTGKHFAQVTLTVYERSAPPRLVIYRMKDVIVTAIAQSVGSTGSEQIVLSVKTLTTLTEPASANSPASLTAPGFTMAMNISTVSGSFVVSSLNDSAAGGQFHDFVINKPLDAASPKLLQASHAGQHFAEVMITLTPASGGALIYKLIDVIVAGDTQQGNASSQTEHVSLNAAKVFVEYRSNTRPPSKMGWDVKQAKAV